MWAPLGAAMATESRAERGEQMDLILGLRGGGSGGNGAGGAGSPAAPAPAVKPGMVLTALERVAKEQQKMQQKQERERSQSVHIEKAAMLKGMLAHQREKDGPISFP